jgi:hypothetical protein
LSAIDFAQLFIAFLVLLLSLTVHESARALAADCLGDGLLPGRMADGVDYLRPYGFFIIYALMLTGVPGYLVGPPY